MSPSIEIGSCVAIVKSVSTTVDGGALVKFEIGSDNADMAARLMDLKMSGKDLVQLGLISIDHDI